MLSPHSRLYIQSPSKQSSYADLLKGSRAELQKAFKNLDQSNQGIIKKSTILSASMYTSEFYDRKVIENQLAKCTEDITFDKFTQIFEMAQVYKQDKSAQWIFKLYDKDKKGFIDKNDLFRASLITGIELSQEEIDEMLKADNPMVEGRVYFDDFAEIMSRQVNFID